MRVRRAFIGLVVLFFAAAFFAVPSGYICGAPILVLGLILLLVGLFTSPPTPASPPQPLYYVQQPVYYSPPPPPPQPQLIQQKEVVTREIIKVRCRNCGALADVGVNNCPSCGAPMR